ncbi:hypothetical protein EYC80_009438 [Monilinia laxa]|uniref:LAGLIDADG endonuclease n=1 Tax=Monilinia laxa TaxID=61186 RepID=A0A5N6JY89_MONLA|nr:hypothetical protein EYC80_009438 [Monilinia laxa]
MLKEFYNSHQLLMLCMLLWYHQYHQTWPAVSISSKSSSYHLPLHRLSPFAHDHIDHLCMQLLYYLTPVPNPKYRPIITKKQLLFPFPCHAPKKTSYRLSEKMKSLCKGIKSSLPFPEVHQTKWIWGLPKRSISRR